MTTEGTARRTSPKPTHVYIARNPNCGCVVGVISDEMNKTTGQHVAEFIGNGYPVTRHDRQTYTEHIIKEVTFLSCPHGQMALEIPE